MTRAALQALKCVEISSLTATIIIVWLVMSLPVAFYFLSVGTNRSLTEYERSNSSLSHHDGQVSIDSINSVCSEGFFADSASGGIVCRPSCSSWKQFSSSVETASVVIIGVATVVGILTTALVIILSLTCFKRMLTFPSVLVLYQNVIVSIHGVNVLIGFANRRLFCTSDDLVESINSGASPYCTLSGFVSSYMGLPLTVWIAIQVTFTFLGVYTPAYFKRLKEKKWKLRLIHCFSFFAGIVSLLVPASFTVGFGGYSPLSTKFPPITCFAINRDLSIYMFIVPVQILLAVIVTELILIFYSLLRNTCAKASNKYLIKAEAKVVAICGCYVIIGLGSSFSYALSSASLPDITSELMEYFTCEQTHYVGEPGVQQCDRSELEQFVNPAPTILGFSLLALYPTITLIYFLRKKRKPCAKQVVSHSTNP